MERNDVKKLAEKFDYALAILDEVRASSGFDIFGERRIQPEPRRETALEAAVRAYDDRRTRAKDFADDRLFSEPAWDILLDLFIHQSRHEQVTVRRACIDSGASDATAMRWLKALESEALISIQQDPVDDTVQLVSLTAEGYESMLRYMERIAR